jgi:hypothetical protein
VVAKKTIYVVDNAGALWTWIAGTSTEWHQEKALDGIPIADRNSFKAIDVVSEVMFVIIKKAGVDQVYRSLPTIDSTFAFKPYPGSINTTLGGQADGMSVFDNADSTFNVKITLSNIVGTYPDHPIVGNVRLYTDTAIGQLTQVNPADKAELNNPVDLSWNAAKTTGTVNYFYEVARDTDFKLVESSGTVTSTTALGVGAKNLTTGQTYYWRVHVASTGSSNLDGLWSETRSFTVKTIGIVNPEGIGRPEVVYPAQGATAISTTPVLTWGVVPGATYNVKIATDSAFSNIFDSKDGLTVAVYTPSKALSANTVYFWEVQAVVGGIASDWVAFAFTTAAAPTPTGTAPATTVAPPVVTVVNPTPIVTVTIPPSTPLAPATPMYIWFIIVIGAVLVVVVIVLIVRTRRV